MQLELPRRCQAKPHKTCLPLLALLANVEGYTLAEQRGLDDKKRIEGALPLQSKPGKEESE